MAEPPLPEPASGLRQIAARSFNRQAVVAANPLAAEAGALILRQGGNALDAAIAVQMALAVVEPQSSGIGGGAFLLHWNGRRLSAWDGRETAPAAADETLFLRADGRPLPFATAQLGGRAVGVPGAVRMLEAAHRREGRLPWAALFGPAIALADEGFALSPRLHALLAGEVALRHDAQAGPLFFDAAGAPHPVGHRLRNPALAEVLRQLAASGSGALHGGPVAADIVRRVRGHAEHPGQLHILDLAGYAPVEREPLCADWRERWRVCGFPPPSSGMLAQMQILQMLDLAGGQAAGFDAVLARPPQDHAPPAAVQQHAGALHLYAEAARLAFADRARYVADPAFVPAPGGDWARLLSPRYLAQRAAAIGPQRMTAVSAGDPGALTEAAGRAAWPFAAMPEQPAQGTSHLSVVDALGGAVALTTTIEAAFGSRLMSDGGTGLPGGFLLNNQLTDFALAPRDAAGRPVANRVEPGKRPRSSMSPTLVFDRTTGEPVLVTGSALGPIIIHAVARTMRATLAAGLDVQQAVGAPNFAQLEGPLLLERGRFPPATRAALRSRGHEVVETDLATGLHALQRTPQGWQAGADPRREGEARGD
jgi:gamma-glutamyltranspeptidase/glutathione hydrolase